MIKTENLSKSFNSVQALKNVKLHVKKGSIYGLLGTNGAGKTTLLKLLAGIYKPSNGTITINEQPSYENTAVKKQVVLIPDVTYFLPHSSIKQMGDFYQHFYPTWNQEKFERLESIFNIDPNKKIHRLSKGMKRQVAFWLALSIMPDILILDEPIDGLDPVMRQKVKSLLFQDVAERQLTILISSHNLREIEDLCDHVGIMDHGKLIIEKELDNLKSDTHKVQVAFSSDEQEQEIESQLRVLYKEKRGSVTLFIVKGTEHKIKQTIYRKNPILFDLLPLTLEEIFIYEMGDIGYDIEKKLL
ncbi:ABC transporter ATP-binding protein [Bacillus carboniphilus]|uniref:ABC transporter ATP-binding protein n=1 Tax=Bacillus carboniphilus TaxID=86663 RepID=A0ABY9JU16_9BACI|nr:ABC transporter ATP-binding protein [Bacillus carboniphilus]WLR41793.1 ABC transporter ATP-binding protein [Bacillus carboniphilus]